MMEEVEEVEEEDDEGKENGAAKSDPPCIIVVVVGGYEAGFKLLHVYSREISRENKKRVCIAVLPTIPLLLLMIALLNLSLPLF
jgi:hypothetical protein